MYIIANKARWAAWEGICMKKVFIDGSAGTTGLRIFDRLRGRTDIQLLTLPESERKLESSRKRMLNEADVVFLCLPDDAAREAASWVENPDTVVLDTSTAHRTAPGWCYGFPELSPVQEARLRQAKRIAVPGCHASGFIALVYPLISAGLLAPDVLLSCYSLTGYSGGGKKMIAEYESPEKPQSYFAPRIYGLTLKHKHLPEMQKVCGLDYPPVFSPIVDDYYKGMAVTIQLQNRLLNGGPTAEDIYEKLAGWYDGQKLIKVHPFGYDGMIAAADMAGRDSLELIVNGHGEQTMVTALFDNLGKGASGAAVQNMNLMLGFEETAGLAL